MKSFYIVTIEETVCAEGQTPHKEEIYFQCEQHADIYVEAFNSADSSKEASYREESFYDQEN